MLNLYLYYSLLILFINGFYSIDYILIKCLLSTKVNLFLNDMCVPDLNILQIL